MSLTVSATAGIIGQPRFVQPTVAATPAGYIVNDLLVDFDGRIFGQQLLIELTQGSIYNTPDFGGNSPPNAAIFSLVPELASDSFVAMGGADAATSAPVLIVGGAVDLHDGPTRLVFDDERVSIAWAATPGLIIQDQLNFQIARLTLSDDAIGRVALYTSYCTAAMFPDRIALTVRGW
ncbi:hypothetical protein [Botrimarina hoheduenensis]|uniref:hypothetical protein n=1 Tax=Botrimarina hoheduenensis TaxID=2528000 RepID=UPI0011B38E85|nr:hypothetical protein [Botrimarina hoheduenensis]